KLSGGGWGRIAALRRGEHAVRAFAGMSRPAGDCGGPAPEGLCRGARPRSASAGRGESEFGLEVVLEAEAEGLGGARGDLVIALEGAESDEAFGVGGEGAAGRPCAEDEVDV